MDRLILWHRLLPTVHDDRDQRDAAVEWLRRIEERLRAARGTTIALIGSSLAASFESVDVNAALDAALELLAEADTDPKLRPCFGAAIGPVSETTFAGGATFLRGTALDRAQLLCNRARPGELVLDLNAVEHAETTYLLGRPVGAGPASLKGRTIDRAYPYRADCRPAIRHLRTPTMPPTVEEQLGRLIELTHLPRGSDRVILRGPLGSGAREWVEHLRRIADPPLLLRLEGVPASLEPLGALRLCLGAALHRIEAGELWPKDEGLGETLWRIAQGRAVGKGDAVAALRGLLARHKRRNGRPWIVLDPMASVDPSSLEVIAEVSAPADPPVLVIGRLPLDARPPTAFLQAGPVEEITIPLLRTTDARHVSESILGPSAEEEVVRRIAVLGGVTPLGVEEAARALIAAGDLVFDDDRFHWRLGPRTGVTSVPVESLIEERLGSLAPTMTRVLEAISLAPAGTPTLLIESMAEADGLSPNQLRAAVEGLRQEALLSLEDPWTVSSDVLRVVVTQGMPPARTSELYRFLSDAMDASYPEDAVFAQATRGFYIAEGGFEQAGAEALLRAGEAAAEGGFGRTAVRLAAAAVQFDEAPETKTHANRLSRAVAKRAKAHAEHAMVSGGQAPPPPPPAARKRPPVPPPVPEMEPEEPTLASLSIRAIQTHDFDTVDRLMDAAIAEGRGRAAAERLRAMGSLSRGDLAGAIRSLAKSRDLSATERAAARHALARGLVFLHAGEPEAGIRHALETLAQAREASDATAERAALRLLSECFRALGRPEDAELVHQVD
ncbi:MAG: hypothetical protein AAGF12_08165 [Myxococcota bacterium]